MHPSFAVVVLFAASVGWGLTWVPIKYLNGLGVQGVPLVLIAFASAALVLSPALLIQRARWRGHAWSLVMVALLGGFANLAFQTALYHGEVVRVMILFYLLPVWSVLGGRIFLGERIDAVKWAATVAALTGAVLILGGIQVLVTPPDWIDLLAIGSGMAFSMNNIVFRATPSVPVASKVTAMFAGCALLIGTYLLLFSASIPAIEPAPLVLTILYGVVWLTLITFGTQWGVTHIEAGRASIIIVMELVVAVVSAAFILGETMAPMEIAGAALVLTAALVEAAREYQTAPAPG
jgi:drug/metabolite transporter (DMT)-like permease